MKLNRTQVISIVAVSVLLFISLFNLFQTIVVDHPGKSLYKVKCADCHGERGEGIRTLVPPLMNSDFLRQHFDSIPRLITQGINTPITVNGTTYDQPMYPLKMDEVQIANILNYLNSEFLHNDSTIDSRWVLKQLNH